MAVVALVVLLIALLPTLVSWGLGQGVIRGAIEKSINGKVGLNGLSVGWFSPLNVQGFTITDAAGSQVVNLDVQVSPGLLKLATSRSGLIAVDISGSVKAERRADGSIDLADLFAAKPTKPPGTPPPTPPSPKTPQSVAVPQFAVNVKGLTVQLTDAATKQVMAIDPLTGTIAGGGALQPFTIDLQGKTVSNGVPGSIVIKGETDGLVDSAGQLAFKDTSAKLNVQATSILLPLPLPEVQGMTDLQSLAINVASDDLTGKIVVEIDGQAKVPGADASTLKANIALDRVFSARGNLSPAGGSANIVVQMQSLPILAKDVRGSVQSLDFTVRSEDLAKSIDMTIDGRAQLEGHEPSTLTGKVTVEQLFTKEGKVDFGLDRVTGSITGKAVPTPPLQPFLAATPIVALRDIGPTLDVDARFASGAQRDVSLIAAGSRARLEIKANVGEASGPITGTQLLLASPAADPVLVKGLTGLEVDRPTDVEILLTSFSLPAKPAPTEADPDPSRPMPQYAATGSLKINGPTGLILGPAAEATEVPGGALQNGAKPRAAIELRDVVINIDSPELAQHLKINGSANAEGGRITINETITNLFDEQGKLSPMNANPVGVINVQQLPGPVIAQFAPGQEGLVSALIGEALNASVDTSMDGADLKALVQAKAAALDTRIVASRRTDALRVSEARIGLTLTPELAKAAQGDKPDAIELAAPASAVVQMQPFELPAKSPGQYELPSDPLRVRISLDDAVISKAPSITEAVGVRQLIAEVNANLTEPQTVAINGEAHLRRPKNDRTIATMNFDAAAQKSAAGYEPTSATLVLDNFSVRELEQVLGRPLGALSLWTGDAGKLTASLDKQNEKFLAVLEPQFPNFAGKFNAGMDGEMLNITGETSTFLLSRAALEQRLNPAPSDSNNKTKSSSTDAADASHITVQADVPMSLAIGRLRVPLAMVRSEPFDPSKADIALAIGGGPMKLSMADGSRTTVKDLEVKLNTANIAKGLDFSLTGKADAVAEKGAQKTKAGVIDVQGSVIDLVNAQKVLDPAAAKLKMVANVNEVPTALADVLVDMQGLLVAALGPQMKADFDADNFSANSGRLQARIDTTNGFLEAHLQGREGSFRTPKNKAIEAELEITPPLRQRLLQKLHPILADIRTTEQPLRVDIPMAVIPTGGDISKLRADIEVTIGKVELDSGSTTLKLLSLFNQKNRDVIPGEIEPIVAKIRNGILTYDTFAVHIDKYTLVYSGQVDLVNRTVDLRTQIPLQALGDTFRELQGFADKITVPLVTRGSIDNPKTEIDPDFDVGKAALDAGVKGSLDELLKGNGGSLGDLFKNLGRKKQ